MTRSNVASSMSTSSIPLMLSPAELTSKVTVPNACSAAANRASTAASSATSVCIGERALGPATALDHGVGGRAIRIVGQRHPGARRSETLHAGCADAGLAARHDGHRAGQWIVLHRTPFLACLIG